MAEKVYPYLVLLVLSVIFIITFMVSYGVEPISTFVSSTAATLEPLCWAIFVATIVTAASFCGFLAIFILLGLMLTHDPNRSSI